MIAAAGVRSSPISFARMLALGLVLVGIMGAKGADSANAIERGRQFLVRLHDPEVGLLPEFKGSQVYWLYHDNYLAAKLLESTRPDLSRGIEATLRRYGVTNSGKIEIVFGESRQPLPFRHYLLTNVATLGGRTVRTELVTTNLMTGWEKYADLLLLAAIAQSGNQPEAARKNFDLATALWDGRGFNDEAARHAKLYATFKNALWLIAAGKLQQHPPILAQVRQRLEALQGAEGGWITDYDATLKPVGLANVETTCLALLALQSSGN